MVFSSITFLFCFLPAVLTLHAIPGWRWRLTLLLAADLLFYAWGEGAFALVILASILGNWLLGLLLRPAADDPDPGRGRALFVAGIGFNLALLFAFKYAGFAAGALDAVLAALSLPTVPVPKVHLPIGISFFTFQALSYLIDIRRGAVPPSRSLLNFAVYKSLFPQLIAGPIVRYRDVAAQFTPHRVPPELYVSGIRRFVVGLGKKVLVANTVAAAADRIFALPAAGLGAAAAWLGILCYTLQIYFDFSGYSDMAIGIGRMLGFRFLENFDYPYRSASVREFWRRWHISLSSWFRDYLYVPLGGNRRGRLRTGVNLMAVFLLCGLWHGAAWTFVAWGAWHGLFLVLERTRAARRLQGSPLAPLGHAYALLVVMAGWVFFRAESLPHAGRYLLSMAGAGAPGKESALAMALLVTPKLLVAIAAGVIGSLPVVPAASSAARRALGHIVPGWAGGAIAAGTLAAVFLLSAATLATGSYNPFIYFRF
jgi:alginate O-acetyltransferase complex protein AlgI